MDGLGCSSNYRRAKYRCSGGGSSTGHVLCGNGSLSYFFDLFKMILSSSSDISDLEDLDRIR